MASYLDDLDIDMKPADHEGALVVNAAPGNIDNAGADLLFPLLAYNYTPRLGPHS